MKWKHLKNKAAYYSQFIPFTLYTPLYLLLGGCLYKLLYPDLQKGEPISSYAPLLQQLGRLAFWFFVVCLGFSLLMNLINYLWFIYKKSKQNPIQFNYKTDSTGQNNSAVVQIKGARKPWLGFLKLRFNYNHFELTKNFSDFQSKIFKAESKGVFQLELPDIKNYQFKNIFLFFEDWFRFFSWPVKINFSNQINNSPKTHAFAEQSLQPQKSNNLDVRIDEMRHTEGDLTNYKEFESGDEVRRIVWKLYAKNRELVVRIPERFEPYASEFYLYASFYVHQKWNDLNHPYFRLISNYYKNEIWSVYQALLKHDLSVVYVSEKKVNQTTEGHQKDWVQNEIVQSTWQQSVPLSNYCTPQHGAALLITSLNDAEELEKTIENALGRLEIYYLKASEIFKKDHALSWVRRLFLLPKKDELSQLKNRWWMSKTAREIKLNESLIEKVLAQHQDKIKVSKPGLF